MIVKFLEDYRRGLRLYKEGDTTEVDKDFGRRLIQKSVATVVEKPPENMAIDQDWIKNRSQFYE